MVIESKWFCSENSSETPQMSSTAALLFLWNSLPGGCSRVAHLSCYWTLFLIAMHILYTFKPLIANNLYKHAFKNQIYCWNMLFILKLTSNCKVSLWPSGLRWVPRSSCESLLHASSSLSAHVFYLSLLSTVNEGKKAPKMIFKKFNSRLYIV